MMQDYRWNDGTELYHSWLKKGAQAKDHKYVARIGTSPNYRYFYTNAEYQIYLRKERLKKEARALKENAANRLNSIKSSISQYGFKEKADHHINRVATSVSAKVNNAKSNVSSTVNKLYSSIPKVTSNISKKAQSIKQDISNGIKRARDLVRASSSKTIDSMSEDYAVERGKILSDYNNKVKKGYLFAGLVGGTAISTVLAKKADAALKAIYDKFSAKQDTMIRQIESESPKTFDDVKVKKTSMTKDEDMLRVNPYYEESDIFKINCSYCTLAYEMRRRGYDVEADDYHGGTESDEDLNVFETLYSWYTHNGRKVDSNKANSDYAKYYALYYAENVIKYKGDRELADIMAVKQAYEKAYPGVKYYDTRITTTYPDGHKETSYDAIMNDIKAQGTGARGQFLLYWKNGGAHSVVYEVDNGNVILRDCQTGKKVDVLEYYDRASEVRFFRTDNEGIEESALKGVKNKTEDTVNTNTKTIEQKYKEFINAGYTYDYSYTNNGTTTYWFVGPDKKYYKWDPNKGTFEEEGSIYYV